MPDPVDPATAAHHQLQRARLRLFCGLLQFFGATAGLLLLVRTGASTATVGVVAGTGVVSIVSRILFHRGKGSRRGMKDSQ